LRIFRTSVKKVQVSLKLDQNSGTVQEYLLLLLLPGAELPLIVESFGFLNDFFPFPSNLNASYPVFYLHLAKVLFDVILLSVLGASL